MGEKSEWLRSRRMYSCPHVDVVYWNSEQEKVESRLCKPKVFYYEMHKTLRFSTIIPFFVPTRHAVGILKFSVPTSFSLYFYCSKTIRGQILHLSAGFLYWANRLAPLAYYLCTFSHNAKCPHLARAGSSATVLPPRTILPAALRTISCPESEATKGARISGEAALATATLADPVDTLLEEREIQRVFGETGLFPYMLVVVLRYDWCAWA